MINEAEVLSEENLRLLFSHHWRRVAETYAAIRLRDMNQIVALIEVKIRLRGHTEIYIDPVP